MFQQRSLLSFVEPSTQRNMPSALRELSRMSYLDPVDGIDPKINHRLSWIGDWWLSSVTCEGSVRCRMDPSGTLPNDYVLLTLALEGQSPVKMHSAPVGKPDGITLSLLDSFYEISSTTPFNHIIVHVPRADLDRFYRSAPLSLGRTLSTAGGAGAVLAGALRALTYASEAGGGGDKSLNTLLPGFALLLQTSMARAETAGARSERLSRRGRVMEYLRNHVSDCTLVSDNVAAACGLSRRQLYREFDGGESFAKTARRLRVEKAAFELSLEKGISVEEVAYRCGFASTETLVAHFRAHYGCTPREYRRRPLS
jgi:AraC-like DNA-binding protein